MYFFIIEHIYIYIFRDKGSRTRKTTAWSLDWNICSYTTSINTIDVCIGFSKFDVFVKGLIDKIVRNHYVCVVIQDMISHEFGTRMTKVVCLKIWSYRWAKEVCRWPTMFCCVIFMDNETIILGVSALDCMIIEWSMKYMKVGKNWFLTSSCDGCISLIAFSLSIPTAITELKLNLLK